GATMPPARHLLISTTEYGHDKIAHRAYHVTDRDLAGPWDGASPPRVPFARVVRTALDAGRRVVGRSGVVRAIRLERQEIEGWDGPVYYWTVTVESPRSSDRSVDLVLTYRGRLIEPEVRVFDHPDRKR